MKPLLLLATAVALYAQTAPLPTGIDAVRAAAKIKDPDEAVDFMIRVAQADPPGMNQTDLPGNFAQYVMPYVKKYAGDGAKVRAMLDRMDASYATAATPGRAYFGYMLARNLRNEPDFLDYAEKFARNAVDLVDEALSVANTKSEIARRVKIVTERGQDPNDVPPFHEGDAKERYKSDLSRRLTLLGSIELKRGKTNEAAATFNRANRILPSAEALATLADLARKRNDKPAELDYLAQGYLTGKLDAAPIERFRSLYRELHPGASAKDIDRYLDDRYAKDFRNPVQFTDYRPSPQRSKRVVFAELFSGAGCEPCMSMDLSFDAALKRYTRDELAMVVYHANAPSADPLSNSTVRERETFYDTKGSAPHLFLDGKEHKLEEGLPSHAQSEFEKITAALDKRLDQPEGAGLKISGKLDGKLVRVTASADGSVLPEHVRLRILLVEKELSYSGENTLRFQPMIVRATARWNYDYTGFPISKGAQADVNYTFSLDGITADNLAWYDWYIAELRQRIGRDLTRYRERFPSPGPEQLAVIAFLQNDTTKEILQSAYADVVH